MSKLNAVIVAVCAAAGGFFLGLLAAFLSSPSFAQVIAKRDRLAEENKQVGERLTLSEKRIALAKEELASREDWGILDPIRANYGPGSAFLDFASQLHAADAWKLNRYWTISKPISPFSGAHLDLTAVGDGKVYIEAVVHPNELSDRLDVILLFKAGEVCILKEAVKNFRKQILAVGQAMNLTDVEFKRLDAIALYIPLARPSSGGQALTAFLECMPPRVVRRFFDVLILYAKTIDPEKALQEAARNKDPDRLIPALLASLEAPVPASTLMEAVFPVDPTDSPPAIGLPLSDEYIAELVFGGAGSSVWGDRDVNYYRVGPWWSLVIHNASDTDWTSPKEPQEGLSFLTWPRLTIEEVDALAASISE